MDVDLREEDGHGLSPPFVAPGVRCAVFDAPRACSTSTPLLLTLPHNRRSSASSDTQHSADSLDRGITSRDSLLWIPWEFVVFNLRGFFAPMER